MQDNSLVTLISIAVIGLIGLGAGTVIGYILAGMRSQPGGGQTKAPPGMDEAVRIWRDRRSGHISIEMDGNIYRTQSEMKSRQKTALASVHDELQLWLGIADLPARVASLSATVSPPAGAPTARVSSPPEFSHSLHAQPSAPTSRPEVEPQVQPPSMDIGNILARAMGSGAGKEKGPAKSIAAQVDEIVQERLPDTPYRGRALRLQDSPDGGIVVIVDDKKFFGVGEVADPAVRSFLQSCVAEWERRMAAG